MWLYEGKEFTSDDIKDFIGFVYMITNEDTGKKYIGKKLFFSTRRLPPLKGKKQKRKVVKESDWQTYHGSSEEVKSLVEQGVKFHREILHLCKSKGELSYMELYFQVNLNALLDDRFYNRIIQCKIHANHVNDLIFKQLDNINSSIEKIKGCDNNP